MSTLILVMAGALAAQAMPELEVPPCTALGDRPLQEEVWLLTLSPGGEPYTWLGHTALYVRSPQRKMNHIVEYGAFDSRLQEPFSALMTGTLECRWKVMSLANGLKRYALDDRGVYAQRLDLPEADYTELTGKLRQIATSTDDTWSTFHFRDRSCASEARDLIDEATHGSWSASLRGPSPLTAREEVMRHLAPQAWAWFGLGVLTGPEVDLPLDRWQAGFIPERLAEYAHEFELGWPDQTSRPLVDQACLLHQGSYPWPLAKEPPYVLGLAALGTLLAGLVAMLGAWTGAGREVPRRVRRGLGLIVGFTGLLAGIFGIVGPALAALSEMGVYTWNRNWLLAHPLSFALLAVGIAWGRGRRPAWARKVAVATGALAALHLGLTVVNLPAQDTLAAWLALGAVQVAVGLVGWFYLGPAPQGSDSPR